MSDQRYDAIIVGGGHNGLTCGAYLAKAGVKTLVVERRPIVGGAAVTEEIIPGFRASTFSYIMGHVHPKVINDLKLKEHGLEFLPMREVITPLDDGDYIVFTHDKQKNLEQIARFSKKDAEAWPAFFDYMQGAIQVVRDLLLETPVDPSTGRWRDFKNSARLLWQHRKIGKHFHRLADALTMSAHDYVSQWFESDVVKAVICYWAVIGNSVGPYAPNTAFNILFHLVGENGMGFARGGMGSISEAIAAAGRQHGMEIRTDAPVAEIIVENGQSTGIRLESGEVIRARTVAANTAAPITFGRMVDQRHLPEDFRREIGTYRSTGSAFKINCAVDRAPQYRNFDPEKAGVPYPAYAHIGPSVDYFERAYDEAKYGWYSSKPYMSPIVPSAVDDTLAPAGKHVVTLYGGQAPYELKGASWDDEQDNFVKNVMDVMDTYCPGFSDSIIDMDVYLPRDMERIVGLPKGHEVHGDINLDQLFLKRPVAGYADYRSPIRGLYQCGASSHPGGAVSCVPGHNAAREILRDKR